MSPALTGFAGLAVLLVMLQSSGGFAVELLGPDLLLAGAGFAVTHSLLHGVAGPSPLAWYRDQLTLRVPLLVLVALAMLAVAPLAGPFPPAGQTAGDAVAGLLPGGTWDVAPGTERPDRVDPLGPLWLIGLLVQFCLLWPVLLAGLHRLLSVNDSRGTPLRLAQVLVAAACAAWLVGPLRALAGAGAAELALGSHVRAAEWLIGAAAAAVVAATQGRGAAGRDPWVPTPAESVGLAAVGTVLLAAMAVLASVDPGSWMRYGGPGAAAFGAAVLLLAAHLPRDGPLARTLGQGFPVELGRMAYPLLLLHSPVFWAVQLAVPAARPVALLVVGGALTWLLGLLLQDGVVRRLRARPSRPRRVVIAIVMAGAAVGVIVAVGGQAAAAAQDRSTAPVVLVLGGSEAADLAGALHALPGSPFTVVDGARPGCGLLPTPSLAGSSTARTPALAQAPPTASDCQEWLRGWRPRIAALRPDAVVVDLGADAALRAGADADPSPCDPQFRARYRTLFADAVRLWTEGATDRPVLLTNHRQPTAEAGDGARRCFSALMTESAGTYRAVVPLDVPALASDGRDAELGLRLVDAVAAELATPASTAGAGPPSPDCAGPTDVREDTREC